MRARVRYTKAGKLRFISAIDLGRVWERSLRRADLPIAYSEGFSPHPRISFPDALTLGYASTGEYAELTFAAPIALPPAIDALNAALPDGIVVLAGIAVAPGAPRLSKWLRASTWDLTYPEEASAILPAAVAAVARAERLPVPRDRKGEVTEVDLRPALFQISTADARVRVTLHHTEPPMRPSEVHAAVQMAGAEAARGFSLTDPALVTRVAQGTPTGDGLCEAITGECVAPLDLPVSMPADTRKRRSS